jgi:hypothetical protein
MGKVLLFSPPADGSAPRPTESEGPRHGLCLARDLPFAEFTRQVDTHTRERVAVLASVLGLTYLTDLCVECALKEIVKLCERPDVYAVLDASDRAAVAKRKVG